MPEPADIRILIHDRNMPFAQAAREYLRAMGYKAEAAPALEGVPSMLKAARCQVLLFAVDSPHSALFIENIFSEFPKLCVITMSDFSASDAGTGTEDAARSSVFARLQKPFDFEDLADALDQAVIKDRIHIDPEERIMSNIGRRLRAARKMRNITLAQLAGQTKLSPSLISKIETTSATPSISTLVKLSLALDIHVSSLFE